MSRTMLMCPNCGWEDNVTPVVRTCVACGEAGILCDAARRCAFCSTVLVPRDRIRKVVPIVDRWQKAIGARGDHFHPECLEMLTPHVQLTLEPVSHLRR